MAMAAISPLPTTGLVRFQDVIAAMQHSQDGQQDAYAGFQGLGLITGYGGVRGLGLGYTPTPDDEATTVDASGNTVYTDWSTRKRYTITPDGTASWIDPEPTDAQAAAASSNGSSTSVASVFNNIFGTGAKTTYQLPNGTPVTVTGPPVAGSPMTSYLLIGGVVLVAVMLLRRG